MPVDRFTQLRQQGWTGTLAEMEAKLAADNTGANIGASKVARPNVTGSRGGNAALASLLSALDNLGIIKDSSS